LSKDWPITITIPSAGRLVIERSGPTTPLRRGCIQPRMRFSALLPLTLLALTACTPHDRSPDEIRTQTARATSTAVRDAKAVTQGVVEGVKQQRTININRASADDLKSLPGIDDEIAGHIIDHRPYTDSEDLVKRHIISRAEYNRIAGKIEAR
jgi:Helix-hairpin-helix motif